MSLLEDILRGQGRVPVSWIPRVAQLLVVSLLR